MARGFLHKHSWLWISFLLSPQAVSSQPIAVISVDLLSNPHVPAPSPHVHWRTHVPVCTCRAVAPTVCVGLTLSCLPQQPFLPPPAASDVPLLSQLISPLVRWLPRMQECLLFLPSPPGVQVPSHFLSSSFSFLLSFVLPSNVRTFPVLSGIQGLLLVFSWCSVRIVPSVDVFLMHL